MEMLTTPRSKATPTQAAAQQPLPGAHWLGHMLDELAYGMLLLDAQGRLLHANHAARSACAGHHPLQLLGDRLQARHDEHAALLDEALQDARRGRRRLLALGKAGQAADVAVVPLQAEGACATLLMLSRRQLCEPLTLRGFARCHALTPAEARLLEGLCEGLGPQALARLHGVSLATVRTQLRSIRTKSGANSLRELVRQLSVLPPIVGSMRGS